VINEHTDTDPPIAFFVRLEMETLEPNLMNERILSVEPKRAKFRTEVAEPTRAKLLIDSEEPHCTKSKNETLDPSRAKLLKDNVLDKLTKLKADKPPVPPTRVEAVTDRAEPSFAILLTDIEEPKLA
jgi:hypothetical protein